MYNDRFLLETGSISRDVFVRPLKTGRNFVFRCVLVSFFLFCFPSKSGTTKNHRTGSSDISFSRDSKDNLNIPKNLPSVEKNRLEIFDFSSIFEQVKGSSNFRYILK